MLFFRLFHLVDVLALVFVLGIQSLLLLLSFFTRLWLRLRLWLWLRLRWSWTIVRVIAAIRIRLIPITIIILIIFRVSVVFNFTVDQLQSGLRHASDIAQPQSVVLPIKCPSQSVIFFEHLNRLLFHVFQFPEFITLKLHYLYSLLISLTTGTPWVHYRSHSRCSAAGARGYVEESTFVSTLRLSRASRSSFDSCLFSSLTFS